MDGIRILVGSSALWFVLSCNGAPAVELYAVHRVMPDVIEPGDSLRIEGDGFVEGPATVRLKGVFKPAGPGQGSYREVILSGKALSDSRIDVPVPPEVMDRITREEVVFQGLAEVSFPGTFAGGVVSLEARSDMLRLKIRPAGGGVRTHASRVREARDLLSAMGIRIDPDRLEEGIVTDAVKPGTPAEDAGIRSGYRLISVDGFPLVSAVELAGLDPGVDHTFEFMSPSGQTVFLTGTSGAGTIYRRDELLAVVLAATAVGLFLSLMVPGLRRRRWSLGGSPTHPVMRMAGIALAAALSLLTPALVIAFQLEVSAALLLWGMYLGCSIVLWAYGEGRMATRLTDGLTGAAVLGAVILSGAAAEGGIGVCSITLAQGATGTGLHALDNPMTTVAVLLSVSFLWPGGNLRRADTPLTTLVSWIMGTVASMIVVFFALGGWVVPGVVHPDLPEGPLSIVAAATVFALKTGAVLAAARFLSGAEQRDRRDRQGRNVSLRLILLLVLMAGGALLEWAMIPSGVRFAGQILSVGIFFAVPAMLLGTALSFLRNREEVSTGERGI